MSTTQNKVNLLIAEANAYIEEDDRQKALEKLKEASQLDSSNQSLKDAFGRLQLSTTDDKLLHALKRLSQDADAGLDNLFRTISIKDTLGQTEARQCLDFVFEQDYTGGKWSEILLLLVTKQSEIRRQYAHRLSTDLDKSIELLYATDNNTSKALFQILFDAAVWTHKQIQVDSQRKIFDRSIQVTLKSIAGRSQRASGFVVHQLILAPENVIEQIHDDLVRSLFVTLNSLDQVRRGQATLAATKLFEHASDKAEEIFIRTITAYISRRTITDLDTALNAAAALFPVIPEICGRLFLTEGFLSDITPLLQGPIVQEVGSSETENIQAACLNLLNAACVDKACRESISKHCQPVLTKLCHDGFNRSAITATLILAKILGPSIDMQITQKLITTFQQHDDGATLATEGLAYVSLQPKNKELIMQNKSLTEKLVNSITRQDLCLSITTILVHITAYRPTMSEEQKKMTQLKAYANSAKPTPEDPLDNPAMVTKRCKNLLDAGVVVALAACLKEPRSTANMVMIAKVLNSLAREAKHRSLMVQQGAIKVLFLLSHRATAASNTSSISHALARILISTNPEHAFNAVLPATTAVSMLVPLLKMDQQQDERDLLPTFEALLALTNLASMNDRSIGTLILRRSWDTLEDQLLLSSNILVQRASVELVCNLMLSPEGIAKFADGSDQARRRLHILLALADVEDLATRRAAGGALAMLTEWDTAVTAILQIPNGIKILLSMCADTHDEIKHRGLVCVLNSVSIPASIGQQVSNRIEQEDGAAIVGQSLKNTKSAEVLAAGLELLKVLT